MKVDVYRKAAHLVNALGNVLRIINAEAKRLEMPRVFGGGDFYYEIDGNKIKIPTEIYPEIDLLLKTHHDKLKKEFEEL